MTAMQAWVGGISVIGPGLSDWPSAAQVLRGRAAPAGDTTVIPPLTVLRPTERRRVGAVVKLALAAGLQACEAAAADPAALATVFASSGGDGANCHAICEALASDDRLISPIRFHNSVNNAASGYWGIATGATAASAIMSAFDGSFAAGLLEALVQLNTPDETDGRVLLIAYDAPYPEPLHACRPIDAPFAIGLLLSNQPGAGSIARLEAELSEQPADALSDEVLEGLRRCAPAARGLALLQLLACLPDKGGACVHLEYQTDLSLAVRASLPT